jgi:hypothetical protein
MFGTVNLARSLRRTASLWLTLALRLAALGPDALKPQLERFIVADMSSQEALPQSSVVWHREVKQLVDDDVTLKVFVKIEKLRVER